MKKKATKQLETKKQNGAAASIGPLIDKLYETRQRIHALSAEAEKIEVEAKAQESELLKILADNKLEGAKGLLATAAVHSRLVGSIIDWPKLTKWIKKTGHFALLQKRISITTYKELLEEGVKVPAVRPDRVISVGLTKRSS